MIQMVLYITYKDVNPVAKPIITQEHKLPEHVVAIAKVDATTRGRGSSKPPHVDEEEKGNKVRG